MSEAKEGFVVKIFTNDGTNSRGPWFAKSFKIESADGTEDPMFFQLGFNKECPFVEGDYIKFAADPKDAKAMTLVEGSGSKVDPANAPTRAEKPKGGGGKGKGGFGGGGAKVKTSELFGEIGGYNTEDDIRRMSYSAARSNAIDVIGMLLEHDALPLGGTKGKAGQPKRFEQITQAVDKLTVEYYYDSASGRKLETVADAGVVDVSADASLPDQKANEPADEAPAGDAPPAADDGGSNGTF